MRPSLEEQELLVKHLVSVALQGEHRPFEFIISRPMKKQVKIGIRALKKFIAGMYLDHERMQRDLDNFVGTAKDKKKLAKSIQAMEEVIVFYLEEIEILKDMIREYRCYCWQNEHWVATLFGRERTEEELVDWRTLPIEF